MTTGDSIRHISCLVDDRLPAIPHHPQAKLYPSELVTIGILFALKGGFFRAFYRWLKRADGDWVGDGTLPDRPRCQRLRNAHHAWCQLLLADPTVFTVIASSPIDLIWPIRHGRRPPQGGTQGQDQGRWRVGITLCWLVNALCRVVAWDWDTMNVNDQRFNPLGARCQGHTIPLADDGFRDQDGVPAHVTIGTQGR